MNLASRLATLAGPSETVTSASAHEQLASALATLAERGETISSAAARDELTHGVDASCEDLGDCFLKHFEKPVRAYRVGSAGRHPSIIGRRDYGTAMEPTIAVIPFEARNKTPEHFDVGNLIADGVIWRLSKATELKVISRLSTNVFRGRSSDVGQVSAHLGATYVLSGGYTVNAGQILVTAELSEARNGQVVWTDRLSGEIGDLLQPESELAHRIAQAVHVSVFDAEVEHILSQPLPTLESYSLLLGSIKLMHRSSKDEFLQTRKLLDELINRHNRIAAPRAWLGNWFILRVTRGWSEDSTREAAEALGATHAALDRDPSDALALATEGFVYLSSFEGPGYRSYALRPGRKCQPQPCPRLAVPRHSQCLHGRGGCSRGGDPTRDGALSARSAALLLRVPGRDGRAFRASIRECRKACALVAGAQSHASLHVAGPDDRARLSGANGRGARGPRHLAAARAIVDGREICRAHAEWATRRRSAMGALSSFGRFAVGKMS